MSTGDDEVRPNDQPEDSATQDDIIAELPAHALDILDDEERDRVLSAVSNSDELQDELRRDEAVVGVLGHALPQQQPPDSLRDRVLSDIRQRGAEPIPLAPRRAQRLYRWATAAAAVLIAGLLGLNLFLWSENQDQEDRIAALNSTMSQRSDRITELEQVVAAQEEELAAAEESDSEENWINFSEPMVWSQLAMTADSGNANGFFCRTKDGSVGWIIVENMPIGSDQVLQAWLIQDGNPVPSSTFVTDEQGRGFVVITSDDQELTTFDQIGITVEPPGGSEEPSSAPVMAGDII